MAAKPAKVGANTKPAQKLSGAAASAAAGHRLGGRVAGVPNKVTREVRDQVIGALEELGGQAYLIKVGKKHPALFMSILGRCIPAKVEGTVNVQHTLASRMEAARKAVAGAVQKIAEDSANG